ncbi:polymerase [Limosilactobacillus caviae]|uniref:Polymerase n=1 Tax=Limosilactobacillus caviae TaxID=1769424 RepID=A0ABQ2C5H0_9LACO|nr:polymerase [Limosilactobacillus caviae]MCD7124496.1 polymerase [Limosilactobacillus caviae]MRH46267.1 polymerase [Limosilactobacillus reuteri]GGI63596.1 hypothetical protein GCM10011459_14300 [Limosilactobacillus caviae]
MALNKLKNKRIYGEQLYFIALSLSLVASFIINTTFMIYFNVKHLNWINYFSFGLLMIKIFVFDRFNIKQYLSIIIIIFLAVLSWRNTQINTVMIIFGFILGAQGVEFKRIIQQYFRINFSLILLTMLYSLLGIIRNLVFFRENIFRYSFGIDYPTDLAAYIFYLCLAYCYLNYKKMNLQRWLLIIGVALSTYLVTNTRLDTLLIILIVPTITIAKRAKATSNQYLKFIASSFWYLSIILPYTFILLTVNFTFSSPIMVKLNQFFSGRLTYGHQGLNSYGITLFGQKIVEHGWGGIKGLKMMQQNPFNYFFIDSSFVRMLLINGTIIGMIAFIILISISIHETFNHDYILPACIFLVVLSSIIDQHMLEITYDPFILSFLSIVSKKVNGGFNHDEAKKLYIG